MDVSIIVITRDACADVLACLTSVRAHRGDLDVEAIVVDNASSDGTAAVVRERFPEVRVIELARNEGGSARNHGLRAARGRHIMFLDSDAELTAGALKDLVAFLDDRPDVGLVGPRLTYRDGTLQHSARRYPSLLLPVLRRPPLSRWFEHGRIVRRHLMHDVPVRGTREAEYVIGACQLFPARILSEVGELDPRIPLAPEDIDWCMRIRLAGYRIAYRPEATVLHGYRRTTARNPWSRAALQHLQGFVYFHWKFRRERKRLLAEARAMEARGWTL